MELNNLKKFIEELHKFHGQSVYSGLGLGISKKKPLFNYVFLAVNLLSRSRFFNLLFLTLILLGYRIFRFPLEGDEIFQYGVSANNEASFKRLNKCLEMKGLGNIAMNHVKFSLVMRLKLISYLPSIWQAAVVLTERRHSVPLVHIQSVIGCASLLLYSCCRLPDSVKVVCVASDHSPVSQALLFLAKIEGRRTCYIQHAPVTDYFPPLTQDLAILNDKASANAYDRAAKRHEIISKTRVILHSPFENGYCRPHLTSERYVVGICLSFLPNLKVVDSILDDLQLNNFVSEVILRPHPRCKLELMKHFKYQKVSTQAKGQSSSDFFSSVDIVLVPNSGVSIEALHNGCPTFFTPGADDLPDDYYELVAKRIIPVFNSDALREKDVLTSFFDDDWESRFSFYDESVNSSRSVSADCVGGAFLGLLT